MKYLFSSLSYVETKIGAGDSNPGTVPTLLHRRRSDNSHGDKIFFYPGYLLYIKKILFKL